MDRQLIQLACSTERESLWIGLKRIHSLACTSCTFTYMDAVHSELLYLAHVCDVHLMM